MINNKRVRNLKKGHVLGGPVLYWMSRDQRVTDNWALAYAIELAENADEPVLVVFTLVSDFPCATWRHYDFMLKGLRKVEARLKNLNIPFAVLCGEPADTLPEFIRRHHVSKLVVDFDPLNIKRRWKSEILARTTIPVDEVDAHNIVPCWIASDKLEFAAYTFRPKIMRLLPEFLDEFPPLIRQSGDFHLRSTNWEAISIALKTDHTVRPVESITPGEAGAAIMLENFLARKISSFASQRNNPNVNFTSGLSPYLHFGHISAQRVALEVLKSQPRNEHTDSFLEELIVRRELSDNYCYYNPEYDRFSGFPAWSRLTLLNHAGDPREYVYTYEQFNRALTHDALWNAAQLQMVYTGTMHGYLRMYWAKKILEWSASPSEAMATALKLNDTYQLDGRDPNGITGCAWSIGGSHDRAWKERNIFGKVRYMNLAGCKRKFDVAGYVARINSLILRLERKSSQS